MEKYPNTTKYSWKPTSPTNVKIASFGVDALCSLSSPRSCQCSCWWNGKRARITRYMNPRESPPSRMLPVVGSSSQGSSSSPRLHYNRSSRSTSAKTLSTYRSCHRYASALLRPLRRLSDSEGMLLLDIIVSCFWSVQAICELASKGLVLQIMLRNQLNYRDRSRRFLA